MIWRTLDVDTIIDQTLSSAHTIPNRHFTFHIPQSQNAVRTTHQIQYYYFGLQAQSSIIRHQASKALPLPFSTAQFEQHSIQNPPVCVPNRAAPINGTNQSKALKVQLWLRHIHKCPLIPFWSLFLYSCGERDISTYPYKSPVPFGRVNWKLSVGGFCSPPPQWSPSVAFLARDTSSIRTPHQSHCSRKPSSHK